jgi:putative membrane protein
MQSQHVSEHLANERTFLAFLRTAIALASFGIAINRFSLYLIQNEARPSDRYVLVTAEQAGVGMVVAGALLIIFAALRFASVRKQIEEQRFESRIGFVIVATVVMVGACIASFFLFAR